MAYSSPGPAQTTLALGLFRMLGATHYLQLLFFFLEFPASVLDSPQKTDTYPFILSFPTRFCLCETSCPQEDYFPPNLFVKVNGKLCPLPVGKDSSPLATNVK